MIGLIIKQANWGVAGSIFGFVIGFFIKIYLIDIVGVDEWGKYVSAHALRCCFLLILSSIPSAFVHLNVRVRRSSTRIVQHTSSLRLPCVPPSADAP